MVKQGESMFAAMYKHYTVTERLDHNTACGFVAGSAISMMKLTKESMQRMAGQ